MSKEESEANIERTELRTATLESLLADLANLESSSGEKNEAPLYLKFKALIYLNPESSAALGKILAIAHDNLRLCELSFPTRDPLLVSCLYGV